MKGYQHKCSSKLNQFKTKTKSCHATTEYSMNTTSVIMKVSLVDMLWKL